MTSEHMIQAQFVSWFRRTFKGVLIFAIPNGGKRDVVSAARLKVEGVVSGIPDLEIPAWGLYIEMKKPGEKLKPNQIKVKKYLEGIGKAVLVFDNLDDAINGVTLWVNDNIPIEKRTGDFVYL